MKKQKKKLIKWLLIKMKLFCHNLKLLHLALKYILLIWILSLNLKVKGLLKKRRMKKMEKKMKETILVSPEPVTAEVPPYPEKKGESGTTQFIDPLAQGDPEPKIEVDTKQLSYDLVEMAGKIWHLTNPKVREFERKEITNIAGPLAAVIEKHDLTKYMKYLGYSQEILLVYNTFTVVSVRVKELKKPSIDAAILENPDA
jgi:hypothetical protein